MKNAIALPALLLASAAAWVRPVTPPGISQDVREFLSHVSMVDTPDGQGGTTRTALISGVNVQIVNGAGGGVCNRLGNLTIGYNFGSGLRTGSHCLIVGDQNSYRGLDAVVFGQSNTVDAPYASVLGGSYNTVTEYGSCGSVGGGKSNTADWANSVVSGGKARTTLNEDDWAAGSLYEND